MKIPNSSNFLRIFQIYTVELMKVNQADTILT